MSAGQYKPRTLDEVDIDFENAVDELRRRKARFPYGRIHLVIEQIAGLTTYHHVEGEPHTTEDIERVMRGKPGWDK
jgi:hypothetical protein